MDMPQFVRKNLGNLANERKAKNLARKTLSQITGVSMHALEDYESKKYGKKTMQYTTAIAYNKLADFFDWEKVDIPPEVQEKAKIAHERKRQLPQIKATKTEDTFKFPDEKPLPINPKFKFSIGEKYQISDTKSKSEDNERQIMIYVGKAGRHHQFRNMSGGWKISFTDNQLIGKIITGGKFNDNRTPWD